MFDAMRSWFGNVIAWNRKDAEQSEALRAMRKAVKALASTPQAKAGTPAQVVVNVPEQKIPTIEFKPQINLTLPDTDEEVEITARDADGRVLKSRKRHIQKWKE